MLPTIWIIDTYSLMIAIGIIFCFLLFSYLIKVNKMSRKYMYDVLILACISIAFGLLSATFFQWIYNLFDGINRFESMTFYGGLIGAAILFIVIHELVIVKHYDNITLFDIVSIAPPCITIAHAFGRIGCFMAGCCYGIETDSILGVMFPGFSHKVYPTQLFESAFLFLLTIVLVYFAKRRSKFTMPTYLISYGVFRFFIEFIRGDERGLSSFILSPSQIISILFVALGVILIFILKPKKINDKVD